MDKKYYNKLVRDYIPQIIRATGKKPVYRILTEDEYKQALKAKLLEEVNEFLDAKTNEEMKEEIVDIKQVLSTIIEIFELKSGLERIAFNKTIEKGEFSRRYFLESVEE